MQRIRRALRLRKHIGKQSRSARFNGRNRHATRAGDPHDPFCKIFGRFRHGFSESSTLGSAKLLPPVGTTAMTMHASPSPMLGEDFFERPADLVARDLPGRTLVRRAARQAHCAQDH
jgi:hypothetical protein